jgi:hypothetical protein
MCSPPGMAHPIATRARALARLAWRDPIGSHGRVRTTPIIACAIVVFTAGAQAQDALRHPPENRSRSQARAASYLLWTLHRSSVMWLFWLMKPVAVPSAARLSSPWAFQPAMKRNESLPPLMGEK